MKKEVACKKIVRFSSEVLVVGLGRYMGKI